MAATICSAELVASELEELRASTVEALLLGESPAHVLQHQVCKTAHAAVQPENRTDDVLTCRAGACRLKILRQSCQPCRPPWLLAIGQQISDLNQRVEKRVV